MIIRKKDGTAIYVGLLSNSTRLIESKAIESDIQSRENIGRGLLFLLMGADAANRNGHGSTALLIIISLISAVSAISFFLRIRKLPRTEVRATADEIDDELIRNIPPIYAYGIFIIFAYFALFMVNFAFTVPDDFPVIFPIILFFMSAAISYVGFRAIRTKSNNSFQG